MLKCWLTCNWIGFCGELNNLKLWICVKHFCEGFKDKSGFNSYKIVRGVVPMKYIFFVGLYASNPAKLQCNCYTKLISSKKNPSNV